MEYNVSIAIDGRINIKVNADNPNEAKENALQAFGSANIGDVECIGFHAVNAEDSNGNLTDY